MISCKRFNASRSVLRNCWVGYMPMMDARAILLRSDGERTIRRGARFIAVVRSCHRSGDRSRHGVQPTRDLPAISYFLREFGDRDSRDGGYFDGYHTLDPTGSHGPVLTGFFDVKSVAVIRHQASTFFQAERKGLAVAGTDTAIAVRRGHPSHRIAEGSIQMSLPCVVESAWKATNHPQKARESNR